VRLCKPATLVRGAMPGQDAAKRSTPGYAVFTAAALVLGWLALPDVGFRDSGEIGSAGALLGIAHPTGFAIDILLLRLASLLPLGDVAWRQNTWVALEAAAALGMLAHLCDRLSQRMGVHGATERWAGAALAAIGCAASLTVLLSALAVEVYSLALFAVLLAASALERGGRAQALCWLVLGFTPGFHVTAGLCVALLCLCAWLHGGARLSALRTRFPLVAIGALIIAYLPLASAHDPLIDWGDPETPARILQHLTAARIRSAEHGDAALADMPPALLVLSQWLESWPLLPAALVAVVAGLRGAPIVVLAPLALLCTDLAYAIWVNPMGAPDRQVGHVAIASLALLGGSGLAFIGSRMALRGAFARGVFVVMCGALATFVLSRVPRDELADGYIAGELLGSGGPLAAVPPRALIVCTNDDACAAGMFALAVERVRPDVDIAPGQHLWDATVLRNIEGIPRLARATPPPALRIAAMRRSLQLLVAARVPRPVLFELSDPLRRVGLSNPLAVSATAPYLVPIAEHAQATPIAAALASLDRTRAARLRTDMPRSERSRNAWSHVYSTLGETAIGSPDAVFALRTAVKLAPARATAWTNLSVAFEGSGDLLRAVQSAQQAVMLAPQRPTPWVNLARLQLALGHADEARSVLELARRAGVRDARLDQLARALSR
jgi:hypothetical protein